MCHCPQPTSIVLLLSITLAIQGLLCFHMNFGIEFAISMKNGNGIWMGITLNLQIALGSIAIFTILILSIHEHGRSFYLLVFSSISLNFHCRALSPL
jgi:hypothetical protein